MDGSDRHAADVDLNQRLATSGFRFTPQRRHVYGVLLDKRDHPTAEDVFLRAKQSMPDISIATVYNCLDALVKCGMVRQVHLDRAASRFCPNMQEHYHFYCEDCAGVFDIAAANGKSGPVAPPGFRVHQSEVSFRGLCPACARREPSRS